MARWPYDPVSEDPDAIHDNVAGEINAISEKVTPVADDLVAIEDSANGFAKAKAKLGNLPGGGGGGDAGLLATNTYDPGTIAIYETASATMAAVDTTNLRITFTAPASGSVIGVFSALASASTSSPAGQEWGVMDGASPIASTRNRVFNGANSVQVRVVHRFLATGLSGSQTWDWGFALDGGTANARLFAGGVAGAAVMEVWEA